MKTAATLFLALIAAGFLVVLLAVTGCGGGGSDQEPDQPTPKVDCKANPKACQ